MTSILEDMEEIKRLADEFLDKPKKPRRPIEEMDEDDDLESREDIEREENRIMDRAEWDACGGKI